MRNINDFSLDFFSLEGKNAIVTGGCSGLGQCFSLALAKAGANIFVFAAVNDDGETQKLIEDCGVKYHFMQGDIMEEGICDKVADECVNVFGSVDILVNCAGICLIEDVLDRTPLAHANLFAVHRDSNLLLADAEALLYCLDRVGQLRDAGELG